MKEDVLDVLRYLFEQYMDEDSETHPDRETLQHDLIQAGFPQLEVGKALNWVEGLADAVPEGITLTDSGLGADVQQALLHASVNSSGLRHYAPDEEARIDVEARGFILYLEQVGILNATRRELIIEKIMALDTDEIDVEQVQWIVLVVLYNQPDSDEFGGAFARLEDLMYYGFPSYLH